MGNEQASRVVQAPGIETKQDELARPPMMRYSIGAVRNVVTEAPCSANFQILPPKQAEVFRTPEECHRWTTFPTGYCNSEIQDGRHILISPYYHRLLLYFYVQYIVSMVCYVRESIYDGFEVIDVI